MHDVDIYQCADCKRCHAGSAEYLYCPSEGCGSVNIKKVGDELPFSSQTETTEGKIHSDLS